MSHPFNDRRAQIRQEPGASRRSAAGRRRGHTLMRRSACVWLAWAFTTSAAAQTPGPPAISGTGQATRSSTRRPPAQPPQTMLLAVSLFGGSSDEVTDGGTSGFATAGPHADADAMLTYQRRAGLATFGLNGRSVVRRAQSTLTPMRQQGGFDVAVLGQRQQFRASQSVSYSPYYQFGGLTDIAPTPLAEAAQSHGDFANADLAAIASTTDMDWSWTISRRVALSASYNLRRTTFGRSELDMTSQNVGARLTRRIARYVSLRTGYTYRVAGSAFAASRAPRDHDLDVGVDYSRPVSISKRTTLSFGSGSSLTPQDQGMTFHLTGDAALTRLIGRTWNARIGLNRNVHLLEGFAQPLLANAINATVGGALQRRVSFSSSASLSTGTVGLNAGSGNGYLNWSTGAGLSVSIGRRGAFDAQYFFAGDRFDSGVALPPGLPNRQRRRQGIRVGFTWRAPLLGS